ncbi:MAG: hypothetical protein ACE5KG_05035 [Nitrososphaerales archaeon]
MKIEVSEIATKQILAETKKKKMEDPVLTVKSECVDFCCGPPVLNVKVREKGRISSGFELVGEAISTPVYVDQEILPDTKKARLVVNSVGPDKELAAIMILP